MKIKDAARGLFRDLSDNIREGVRQTAVKHLGGTPIVQEVRRQEYMKLVWVVGGILAAIVVWKAFKK